MINPERQKEEQEEAIASEQTRRAMGISSFADTTHAINQDWGPARSRDDAPRYNEEDGAFRDERLREL